MTFIEWVPLLILVCLFVFGMGLIGLAWIVYKLQCRVAHMSRRQNRDWREYMSEADEAAQITDGSVC